MGSIEKFVVCRLPKIKTLFFRVNTGDSTIKLALG